MAMTKERVINSGSYESESSKWIYKMNDEIKNESEFYKIRKFRI